MKQIDITIPLNCLLLLNSNFCWLYLNKTIFSRGRHIYEFGAVFALLLLPNHPRLDCRVSGLVHSLPVHLPRVRGKWNQYQIKMTHLRLIINSILKKLRLQIISTTISQSWKKVKPDRRISTQLLWFKYSYLRRHFWMCVSFYFFFLFLCNSS